MSAAISFSGKNAGLQVGDNHGPITVQVHVPPERPETPPSPLTTVPFPRDRDFIDPGTLLNLIDEKCSVSPSRIALVGLGGVGKSQLAIEYSYRVREHSSGTWCFWIHASNAARFEQSCRDIADQVKIPGRNDPKANVCKLFFDWLHDERRGQWILVLDNLDDDGFFHDISLLIYDGSGHDNSPRSGKPLAACLPISCGSVIITTRSKDVALRLVESDDIIAVEPMNQTHAQALLEKKLGPQEDQEDLAELTVALEFMPLAIVQAAAYIKHRAPRASVKQYLEEIRKSDRRKISLLDREGGQLRRDREAKNSIILTWQISFDFIQKIRPTAADLLSLMSFCDRQGIAECLLRYASESTDNRHNRKEDWDDDNKMGSVDSDTNDQFEDDIITLRNFSFISCMTDATSFEMHRLVQLATQKWLEVHGQFERWQQQFIRHLSREFPTGEYENWEKCQLLSPHIQSAILHRPSADDSLQDWTQLLYRAAWFSLRKGKGSEAENMAIMVIATIKRSPGPGDKITLLQSMNIVALALKNQGKHEKAETMLQQVLKRYKKVLGVDHSITLASMNNLGVVLRDQGKYEEAKAMNQQVLKRYKKILGANHPHTLASMSNLGLVLNDQGKYKKAEIIHRQALETRKKILGVDHPDTLASMNDLGSVLNNQGKYDEAEIMYRRVLEMREKILGVDHPDILVTMNNLGSVLNNQEKYEEAEVMHRRALEKYQKVLGADNPNILLNMWHLAITWEKQDRHAEASRLLDACVKLQRRTLGPTHPYTVSATAQLEDWQQSQSSHELSAHVLVDSIVFPTRPAAVEVVSLGKPRKRDIIIRLFQKR